MFQRVLSILLVGVTLLGPTTCCCTMKAASAESSAPSRCCCQQDDTAKQCPDNSDGKNGHDCPCRNHRSVGARLDDSLILQTSASVKWIIELCDICSPVFFLQSDNLSPHSVSRLPGSCAPMQAGRALLIAYGVSRC